MAAIVSLWHVRRTLIFHSSMSYAFASGNFYSNNIKAPPQSLAAGALWRNSTSYPKAFGF